MPPREVDVEAQRLDQLRSNIPPLIPGHPAVTSFDVLDDDVWLVALADGGRLVAKHQLFGQLTRNTPYDLLQVEFDLLRQLRRRGTPVPVPFGIDADTQTILLEYAGPCTVADALTRTETDERRAWLTRRILQGLVDIEAHLDDHEWEARVAPGLSREDLDASWKAVQPAVQDGLRLLCAAVAGQQPTPDLLETLAGLVDWLGSRPPTLGPSDYRPENIVMDAVGQRVAFIDLAKVGWDWTERRAVQYTTSIGVSGVGLLDNLDVPSASIDRGALDGHLILFRLLLARRHLLAGIADGRALAAALAMPCSQEPRPSLFRQNLRRLLPSDKVA